MKIVFNLRLIFSAMLLAVTMHAHAVIIEGNFNGVVRTFTNGVEDINVAGYWNNVAEGSPVSGSFWYDTDKAPQNSSDFTTSSMYQSYTDEWMKSEFTIDGTSYPISNFIPLDGYTIKSEGVWLFNFEPAVDNSTRERFYLFDNISSGGSAGGYKAIGLMVEISSELQPLLNGLGVLQTFDWFDLGDPTSYGQAYVQIGAITDNERRDATAWVDISEFHLRIKNIANVPEPSSLLLFGVAVLALATRRKRYLCS